MAAALGIRIKTELYEGVVQQTSDGRMETNREGDDVGYLIGSDSCYISTAAFSCVKVMMIRFMLLNKRFIAHHYFSCAE